MKRSSTAIWHGPGKEGSGTVTAQSKVLDKAFYAYGSRFEEEKGTNPEELIAAAHASCYSMKLSFVLGEAGYTPDVIEVTSTVTLEKTDITESHLEVRARVPGMHSERFAECAEKTRVECPVSKALNMKITMKASLI